MALRLRAFYPPKAPCVELRRKFHASMLKPHWFQVIRNIPLLRKQRRQTMLDGHTVGFVPTMGALHQGHLALIRQAARENAHVYVSIYVNPTQFGVNEDLNTYPKTWDADMEKLNELCKEFGANPHVGQITTVFAPITLDMYPGLPPTSELYGEGSFVTITPLSSVLEGASRPVFFRGVATVVMKLLNLVQPETVYFGQKDIQQTLVINRMMQDFHLNTTLRIGPTVREVDGLAMSSRNVYLGKRRRAIATVLLSALHAVETAYAKGATQRQDLLAAALEITSSEQEKQRRLSPSRRAMFEVEYISIAEPSSLSEVTEVSPNDGAVLSGAIKMLPVEEPQAGEDTGLGGGKTMVRLIDNILLDRDKISSRTGINYSLEH